MGVEADALVRSTPWPDLAPHLTQHSATIIAAWLTAPTTDACLQALGGRVSYWTLRHQINRVARIAACVATGSIPVTRPTHRRRSADERAADLAARVAARKARATARQSRAATRAAAYEARQNDRRQAQERMEAPRRTVRRCRHCRQPAITSHVDMGRHVLCASCAEALGLSE